MATLDDIIRINITRETRSISRAGFGTLAIMGEFAADKTTVDFTRARYYANLSEMEADGWGATDPIYKAAQVVFSQNPVLPRIMVGRADTADADWTASLSAIAAEEDDWYFFIITSDTEADVLAASAYAETNTKLYFYSSNNADIVDGTVDTDIASQIQALNRDRSIGIYNPFTVGERIYPESAWPGEAGPYTPGSQTWAYKTLSGVASYALTSAQRTAAFAKNCNIYTRVAGVDVTEEGKVASGEWIDIIRGTDQLEARIQENIFAELSQIRKIPYTDEGVSIISNLIRAAMSESARADFLVEDSIEINVPNVADVNPNDRADRLLPDVSFSATLQGAVHKTSIRGTLSV